MREEQEKGFALRIIKEDPPEVMSGTIRRTTSVIGEVSIIHRSRRIQISLDRRSGESCAQETKETHIQSPSLKLVRALGGLVEMVYSVRAGSDAMGASDPSADDMGAIEWHDDVLDNGWDGISEGNEEVGSGDKRAV
jgi:hypothetical protein